MAAAIFSVWHGSVTANALCELLLQSFATRSGARSTVTEVKVLRMNLAINSS